MTPQGRRTTSDGDPTTGGEAESGRVLKVLLVEDDNAWRNDLKAWLEREGFRAVALSRGEWLISAVELHRPDVVVLDVQLPGENGLDLLGSLLRRWPALPVVITTAFGGRPTADVAHRLGAAGYFDKPFRVVDLIAELRRLALRSVAPYGTEPEGSGRTA